MHNCIYTSLANYYFYSFSITPQPPPAIVQPIATTSPFYCAQYGVMVIPAVEAKRAHNTSIWKQMRIRTADLVTGVIYGELQLPTETFNFLDQIGDVILGDIEDMGLSTLVQYDYLETITHMRQIRVNMP